MYKLIRHATALIVATLIGTNTAMSIEEPEYTVLSESDRFELREYAPYLVAEVSMSGDFEQVGNRAFRILANYIFGGNQGDRKIAMTAPVTQQAGEKIAMTAPVSQRDDGDGTFTIGFTMPSEYTLETLPLPNDERITLREVPPRVVAVRKYAGSWSERGYQRHLGQLQIAMAARDLEPAAAPIWARFNSPFSLPFLRRNEIQIEVAAPATAQSISSSSVDAQLVQRQ